VNRTGTKDDLPILTASLATASITLPENVSWVTKKAVTSVKEPG
jgi:hypothetical protein